LDWKIFRGLLAEGIPGSESRLRREIGERNPDEGEEGEGEGKLPRGADPGHGERVDAFGRKHEEKDQQERGPSGDRVRSERDSADGDPDGGEGAAQSAKQFAGQRLGAMVDSTDGQKVQRKTGGEQIVQAAQGDQETGDRKNGAGNGVHGASGIKVA
jgi:hypothetical protein